MKTKLKLMLTNYIYLILKTGYYALSYILPLTLDLLYIIKKISKCRFVTMVSVVPTHSKDTSVDGVHSCKPLLEHFIYKLERVPDTFRALVHSFEVSHHVFLHRFEIFRTIKVEPDK